MLKRLFTAMLALMLLGTAHAEAILDSLSGAVFSPLDDLGRAGPAVAVLSPDTLDGGDRGSISQITPAGFDQSHYGDEYVFQRCHLIGAQLAPDTEVAENLFTGTVSLNESLMLPLENSVAKYIRETGEHVIYRVEPQYIGQELIPRWVLISVYSIESDCLRTSQRFANTQADVSIDYLFGGLYVPDATDAPTPPPTQGGSTAAPGSGSGGLRGLEP